MKKTTVVTHDGSFHADEVFAIAVLKLCARAQVIPEFDIVRTRDRAAIEAADVVVDVGGEYSPEGMRFDHHQNSFIKCHADGTPFASAGLIWEHFGFDLLLKMVTHHSHRVYVMDFMEQRLFLDIDAVDNGIGHDSYRPTVSSVMMMLNPVDARDVDAAFEEALTMATRIVESFLAKAMAQAIAEEVLDNAFEAAQDGIAVLEEYQPYHDKLKRHPEINRLIFQRDDGRYNIICNGPDNYFEERIRGLAEEEIIEESGVADAVFCHKNGFMAVTGSLATAKHMALNH